MSWPARRRAPRSCYRGGGSARGASPSLGSAERSLRRASWPSADFRVKYPCRGDAMSAELKQKVQELIDTMINPAVAGHGGFVELIDVQDNRVYLQMGGGCQGCGAADITLKSGIERLIKEEIPEVAEVLDTTDHSSGTNPYYQAGKA